MKHTEYVMPKMEDIRHIAKVAGNNPPDPIDGSRIHSWVLWDTETGEIWEKPVIPGDYTRYQHGIIHVTTLTTNTITAKKLYQLCEYWRDENYDALMIRH